MKLPTLGGKGWNTPMAINNAGAVVGFSDLAGDVSGGVLHLNFQAFLWTRSDGIQNLHTLPGDVISEATGINDFGQIVGTSFDASFNSRVFLWQDGRMFRPQHPAAAEFTAVPAGERRHQRPRRDHRARVPWWRAGVQRRTARFCRHHRARGVAWRGQRTAGRGRNGRAPAVAAGVRERVLQHQHLGHMTPAP